MWILYTVIIILILLLGISKLILNMAFGKRCEGNPKLKYFTANDFAGLKAKPIEFKSNKGQTIRGNIYTYNEIKEYKGVVIFAHGMGGGHLSYTTEINTLAKSGFIVVGYDNTGTCTSEGKNLKGLFQAVIDLNYAITFVENNEELKKYPIELMGHSWGAYTVCQVLQYKHKINAVVALSGFNNSADLICDTMRNETKINFNFLKPFMTIINLITFGINGVKKTSKIIEDTETPVLLLHGDLDTSVALQNSPISHVKQKANIKTIVYKNRFHNVYQTKESEEYLNNTFGKLTELSKKYKGKIPDEESKAIYDKIDYKKMTEEDAEIMNTIIEFLEENL